MQDQNGKKDDPKPTDDQASNIPSIDAEIQRFLDVEKEGEDVPPEFHEALLKRLVKANLDNKEDKGNREQGGGGTQSEP